MLSVLGWALGFVAAVLAGLALGVWGMGRERKRKKSRGGSGLGLIDFGFNSRELVLMHEAREETGRTKSSKSGDPPSPDDWGPGTG